ncbi:MAG: NlpC/P60 family protein [Bacteroides sp.]|nr:NlpC/P60 family protein [Bacteroides sp.]
MSKKSFILLLPAVIALFLVSCGSMKNTATVRRQDSNVRGDSRSFAIPKSLPAESNALLTEAKSWIGTPYKYGGEDKHGVDCSGLVVSVYRSALDIKLPRSSNEQAGYCSPLQKNQLMPGDLLFFATGRSKNISHVGIYVGDGKMIHSSASSGVVVSDISTDYYQRTYAGAGSVDRYRAMVSGKKNGKQSAPELPSPSKAASNPPIESAKVTGMPNAATNGSTSSGFTLKPVDSLPHKSVNGTQRANNSGSNTVSASSTPVDATSAKANPSAPVAKNNVKAVTANTSDKKAEPTVDEARKAVLNSIIEQKIDSIMGNR